MLRARVVEAPDFDRIEPELALTWGAKIDDFCAAGGGVGLRARAVVPQGDGVEVFDVESGFGLLEGCGEDGVVDFRAGDQIYGGVEGDVRCVGLEKSACWFPDASVRPMKRTLKK